MITQQLRVLDDEYVVTIPDEVIERHGWQEGQWLEMQITAIDEPSVLANDLRQAIDERWEQNEEALRYLADR